jgi:hypothetical protein
MVEASVTLAPLPSYVILTLCEARSDQGCEVVPKGKGPECPAICGR